MLLTLLCGQVMIIKVSRRGLFRRQARLGVLRLVCFPYFQEELLFGAVSEAELVPCLFEDLHSIPTSRRKRPIPCQSGRSS